MWSFVKHPVFILSGYLIGVIGLIFGVYSYMASVSEREPIFNVPSIRTLIANPSQVGSSQIKVTRADGSKIDGPVWVARFYFWNDGKKPIKHEEILTPIFIKFGSQDVEILDHSIIQSSRKKVIQPSLTKVRELEKGSLLLDFRILESGDYVIGQIVYAGDEKEKIIIDGNIEGVLKINTDEKVVYKDVYMNLIKLIVAIAGFYGLIYLLVKGVKFTSGFCKKYLPERQYLIIGKIFALLFLLLITIFISSMFWSSAKKMSKKNFPIEVSLPFENKP